MAEVTAGRQTEYLPDGARIKDACAALGVPFCCEHGECGTCMIEVAEGLENLEPAAAHEHLLGLPPNLRLACQARIRSGTVRLSTGFM